MFSSRGYRDGPCTQRPRCSAHLVDGGMERALIAHGEIEQGIRFGLDHGRRSLFRTPGRPRYRRNRRIEILPLIHPLSGVIGPDVFIPVAEEIGLIGRLSEHVIGEALREAANWDPDIKIPVNSSPSQLADGWLAQRIVRILADSRFPAERLVIEVTESSLFADIDLARSIATSLKNQGIRLALDDFGTGFSSLSHLRSLPCRHHQDRSKLRHQHQHQARAPRSSAR
jgi:predicted signal transduction protein with EAL and GGDEF domain